MPDNEESRTESLVPSSSNNPDLTQIFENMRISLQKHMRFKRMMPNDKFNISVMEDLSAEWLSANLPGAEISSVAELATSVFGDAGVAKEWLREANLQPITSPRSRS